jgi:hypothetical protein
MLADAVHAVEEFGTRLIRIAAFAGNMAKGTFAIPASSKGTARGKVINGSVAACLSLLGVWGACARAAILAVGARIARPIAAIETLNGSAQGGDGHAVVRAQEKYGTRSVTRTLTRKRDRRGAGGLLEQRISEARPMPSGLGFLPASRVAINESASAVVNLGLPAAYASQAYQDRYYVEVNIDDKSDAALASIKSFMLQILSDTSAAAL